jgi:DNA-binding MarR family transcriptional regulator
MLFLARRQMPAGFFFCVRWLSNSFLMKHLIDIKGKKGYIISSYISNYELGFMTMDAIEQLQELGFSQYEAQAYITLLERSPLNGYELAKFSGIPRPNVYPVLHKLEERGAILRVDTPEGARYAPLASDELIRRLQNHYQASLDTARQALEQIETPPEQEYIWNARGYPALLDHARSFIDAAEKQLLLAVWPQEAKALESQLSQADARGVKITTMCLAGCPQPCGSCRGQLHRTQSPADEIKRWLLVIPDEAEVLAGEVGPGEDALAIRTRQRLLVNLAGWYIRQSIALSSLLQDVGDQLGGLLGPQSRAAFQELGSSSTGSGWFDPLREFMNLDEGSSES